MEKSTLILASASPRRRELLQKVGIPFEIIPSHLREPDGRALRVLPRAWAEALSYFKARSVAERNRDVWVLGADTIVACREHVLGKPRDECDARRMLELQSGVESTVITGVSLVRAGKCCSRAISSEITRVWMREDASVREAYLATGEWSGKAGAYGIQDVGDRLVQRIQGEFDNVVGLPRLLLERMIDQLGIR